MFKRLLYATVFYLLVLNQLTECAPPQKVYSSRENLYKKNTNDLNTKFLAYHISDSVTKLFVTFSNENLLYKRPDTSAWFYCAVKVRYHLHINGKTQQLSDSGSVMIYDRQTEKVNLKNLSGHLFARCLPGQNYVCDIFVYDLNKKLQSAYVLNIDKASENTRQNFLLQKTDGSIIYDYYLHPGDSVIIKSFRNEESNFVVDHFKKEFPLPPPPFSLVERVPFKYRPDSSFVIKRNLGLLKVVIPEKGFYHIITDKETKNGVTLFSVQPAFPGIKDEVEMIKCIRYVTTIDEYTKLMESPNKKQAIDEFWKEKGGSYERAKELIRKYYGRVSEANKLFSSFQPGWQTDRGMIYIVFGPPSGMYKYSESESWVYGNEAQPNAIRFNFSKIINPFSDNDFVLARSEYFKEPWHVAVRGWKEGHILMDN